MSGEVREEEEKKREEEEWKRGGKGRVEWRENRKKMMKECYEKKCPDISMSVSLTYLHLFKNMYCMYVPYVRTLGECH